MSQPSSLQVSTAPHIIRFLAFCTDGKAKPKMLKARHVSSTHLAKQPATLGPLPTLVQSLTKRHQHVLASLMQQTIHPSMLPPVSPSPSTYYERMARAGRRPLSSRNKIRNCDLPRTPIPNAAYKGRLLRKSNRGSSPT